MLVLILSLLSFISNLPAVGEKGKRSGSIFFPSLLLLQQGKGKRGNEETKLALGF